MTVPPKRISILACLALAMCLTYLMREAIGSASSAFVGIVLAACLLYSLTRFLRDLRRGDVTPPRLSDGWTPFGRFALVEQGSWRSRRAVWSVLKGLAALIVGTAIIALIAKYCPECMPRGKG